MFPRTKNPEFRAWDFGETRHSARGLTRRFEIEELVAQDSFRVVYRARDRESGRPVAVRRLLPEGVGGEGYGEEQAGEFDAAVEALASLECPGLRRPVAWGLDPVDRMPFIASEWVEGKTLVEVLAEGEMPAESGWILVERALVVQAALDATGHGWQIDLSAESVLVAEGNGTFQFSFWVAPFPGSSASVSMVKELASLIELAMGWRGRMPAPNAGGGLASWLRLVRQHRMDATDAKAALAESKGGQPDLTRPAGPPKIAAAETPPTPAEPPSQAPTSEAQPVSGEPLPQPPSVKALVIVLLLFALLAGSGGWWLWRQMHPKGDGVGPTGKSIVSNHPMTPAEKASARAAELAKMAVEEKTAADFGPDHVFGPADGVVLRDFIGEEVRLQGVLKRVRKSSTGKTIYLEFSKDRGVDDICGRIRVRRGKSKKYLAVEKLQPLVGKKIQLRGKVQIESGTGRVVINIAERKQITEPDSPK